MTPCPNLAEFRDEASAPYLVPCRLKADHPGSHDPASWARRLVDDPARLVWKEADPAYVDAVRDGPFLVREFDPDGCLVEELEAPTRTDALEAAHARVDEIPAAHWVGWARGRKGALVIGIRRLEDRSHQSFFYGSAGLDGRWSPSVVRRLPLPTSGVPVSRIGSTTTGGCAGQPSAASGHLERGCDSFERHIELFRQGYGISKVRGYARELDDRELITSEYGQREAVFR